MRWRRWQELGDRPTEGRFPHNDTRKVTPVSIVVVNPTTATLNEILEALPESSWVARDPGDL
jgi:hypothetical protein